MNTTPTDTDTDTLVNECREALRRYSPWQLDRYGYWPDAILHAVVMAAEGHPDAATYARRAVKASAGVGINQTAASERQTRKQLSPAFALLDAIAGDIEANTQASAAWITAARRIAAQIIERMVEDGKLA